MSRLLEDRRQDRMKEINSKVSESARRREDLMKKKTNHFFFPFLSFDVDLTGAGFERVRFVQLLRVVCLML